MDLKIIEFCATECERQESGEMSVWRMCHAWALAQARAMWNGNVPDEAFILKISQILEPRMNAGGYRTTPVSFRNGNVISPEHIERQMMLFLTGIPDDPAFRVPGIFSMRSQEAYEYFQKIHPFEDGNGRIGKILFNMYRNTLDAPIFPEEPTF